MKPRHLEAALDRNKAARTIQRNNFSCWALVFISASNLAFGRSGTNTSTSEHKNLVFCTQAKNVDFNLDEQVSQPGFVRYTFARPLIGPEGVIDKIHFSPDGKTVEAVIKSNLVFALSKEKVTARDVANSIAVSAIVRWGKGIFPEGSDQFEPKQLWNVSVPGIEIKSEIAFKLRLHSPSQSLNITGRLNDLLSSSVPSRKGSLIVGKPYKGGWDFVSLYPVVKKDSRRLSVLVNGHIVEIRSSNDRCSNADFYDYGPPNLEDYDFSKSDYAMPRMAILNTNKHSLESRIYIASILRRAVRKFKIASMDIKLENSHFRPTEAKGDLQVDWASYDQTVYRGKKHKSLVAVIPASLIAYADARKYADFLITSFKDEGINLKIEWSDFPPKFLHQDFGFFAFAVAKGRPKWVEGTLSILGLMDPLKNAKNTTQQLNKCYENASATIPINDKDLKDLDLALYQEASIVPLYREFGKVYTKRGLDLKYGFLYKTYPEFHTSR
jgi:hypothetical protein